MALCARCRTPAGLNRRLCLACENSLRALALVSAAQAGVVSRVCWACGESIQYEAKKCRFCGEWQARAVGLGHEKYSRPRRLRTDTVADVKTEMRDGGSGAIKAAWVVNVLGLGAMAIPGWGLAVAMLFITPLWIASFVLACVGAARGSWLGGGLTILFNFVCFPIVAAAMTGFSLASAIRIILQSL